MASRIALISTGGTIEKTYDELEQVLQHDVSVLDVMLATLTLRGADIVRVPLMNKDSREMSDADHRLIARTALAMAESHEGVVIVHGTDTMDLTGEAIIGEAEAASDVGGSGVPPVPIVLTGAMRPYELRSTDAVQNLTEALLAVQILAPGTYLVMHNEVLAFPGVHKDAAAGRFVKEEPGG